MEWKIGALQKNDLEQVGSGKYSPGKATFSGVCAARRFQNRFWSELEGE
jgi:hypothetical protein